LKWGGALFFVTFSIFLELEYLFLLSSEARIFFPEFNIRLYDKGLNNGNYNSTFKYSRAHKKNLKISKGQAESKKDRQYSGQNKKEKRANNDLQNIHIKLKIE
jgi:hypothetical protein